MPTPGEQPEESVLHERVIATPHIGAFTRESVGRAVEHAIDHLLADLQPA